MYKQDCESRLPMLHLAAHRGWMNTIIDLITKYKCDTNCKDSHERTPLHYAASNNHLEVVKYLINEQHCDPMNRDDKGNTPLHLTCEHGNHKLTEYLISEAHCDPSCEKNNGDTPLHIACNFTHTDIVQYLLSTGKVDPLAKNKKGKTPMFKVKKVNANALQVSKLSMLDLAVHYGWVDIVIDLIRKYKWDTNCKDSDGCTPLHYAVKKKWLKAVEYLINEQHCDPMTKDNNGDTPLHIACQYGHDHIVQYLLFTGKVDPLAKNKNGDIPMSKVNTKWLPMLHLAAVHGWMDVIINLVTKYKCDTNCKDSRGHTPLHYAVSNNHLEVVRYFINEQHCDPMTRDDKGNTPLHLVCDRNHTHIIQYLLSTGKVNPQAKNKYGWTPVDFASMKENSYDLLKLFQSFPQCKRDFPVHTYTKLVLTGYSGAGKTTISQLIHLLASKAGFFSVLSSGRVTDVECLTVGIIPLHVESEVKEVGNMVIYDFAGQQEYYSSHAAVLECIMRNSAAIFVCIVDLSQCIDKISESIHYWISFIENTCSSAQGSSHVIIVGSHADRVKSSRELKEKSSLVESIAESRVKQLMYRGFVSMDCRLSKTKEARHFRSLLSTSQQAILSSQPSMSLYCHVLYAFLRKDSQTRMLTGCTLQDLDLCSCFRARFLSQHN